MIVEVKTNNTTVDIFDDIHYAVDDSLVLYEAFLLQNNYSASSIENKMRMARRIHRTYPALSWLQNGVNKNGLIKTGINKDGSAYMHFLCMIHLLDIAVTDYFMTNPTTIRKLMDWYAPYYNELGISTYLATVESVIDRIEGRDINKEKTMDRALKASVYLVMRYHLTNIDRITQEQWNEALTDMKECSSSLNHLIPNTIMGQAFFERGVLDETAAGHFREFPNKERSYDDMPEIKPVVDMYISYLNTKLKKSTVAQKTDAVDRFIAFAKERGIDSLQSVTRKLIYDYKVYILSQGYTSSYNERYLYGVKNFMEFVEANTDELKAKGYRLPLKKVIVKKDFKVQHNKKEPRPIEDKILNGMLDELRNMNRDFRMAFLLMLSTGVAVADMMSLKRDCLETMADGTIILRIHRVKRHKNYKVKASPEAVEIVTYFQDSNTQLRPISHPDGSEAFYLINDGGRNLTPSWFTAKFRDMKQQLADKNPDISREIMKATPHMLRHTFATRKRDSGADIYTLSYLLCHESINTTKMYTRESDRLMQNYVDRLNEGYVCEAIDNISKLTETEQGREALENMMSYENDMVIGRCFIKGYANCPMALRCVDCIYLCSMVEDLPEMMEMLENMKSAYDSLANQGRDEEARGYRSKMKRLISKIKILEEKGELYRRA